jgi:hypothetical protein
MARVWRLRRRHPLRRTAPFPKWQLGPPGDWNGLPWAWRVQGEASFRSNLEQMRICAPVLKDNIVEDGTPASCDLFGIDHARPGPYDTMNVLGQRLAGHGLVQLGKAVDVCLYRELMACGCDAAAELDHV